MVSESLLTELARALAYPKLHKRITPDDAGASIAILRRGAPLGEDPPEPARRSTDPGDDYVPVLAEQKQAFLVSGDHNVLELAGRFPIQTARSFLETLAAL